MTGIFETGKGIIKSMYVSSVSKKLGIYQNSSLLKTYECAKRVSLNVYNRIKSSKLLNHYRNGTLDETILSELTYADLNAVLHYDVELFKKVANAVYSLDLERIKKENKIRLYFFCNSDSVWSCDRLYQLFAENSRFDVSVVVPGFNNGTPETIREMYENTMKFFREKGYKVIGLNEAGENITSWQDIGVPDIVFHLTPYRNMIPDSVTILSLPLTTLNLHIPYALAADSIKWWFNTEGFLLSWKQFIESGISAEVYASCSILGDYNLVVSGHPKTDKFLSRNAVDYYWKTPDGVSSKNVVKIIYAPHHSIFNYSINFSTFHQNFKEMYKYAKDHPDTTSWVIKPHPLLKKASVELGLFKNEEEYEDYIALWDALPNAKSVTTGDYTDLFLTSDAMITDCGSFLTEYQYVRKPMIILTRPERYFDKPSKNLIDGLYLVPGVDIEKLYKTIDVVLLGGNDYLKEKRDAFYDIYLDIKNFTYGELPSENIYKYVISKL